MTCGYYHELHDRFNLLFNHRCELVNEHWLTSSSVRWPPPRQFISVINERTSSRELPVNDTFVISNPKWLVVRDLVNRVLELLKSTATVSVADVSELPPNQRPRLSVTDFDEINNILHPSVACFRTVALPFNLNTSS